MTLRELAIGLAIMLLFVVLLAVAFGAGPDLAVPVTYFFGGLALTVCVAFVTVGAVLVIDLYKLNIRPAVINGKQYLIVQFAKDHVVVLDSTRITEPVLSLSPSHSASPRIAHGVNRPFHPEHAPILATSLPETDTLSDSAFRSLFLSED